MPSSELYMNHQLGYLSVYYMYLVPVTCFLEMTETCVVTEVDALILFAPHVSVSCSDVPLEGVQGGGC